MTGGYVSDSRGREMNGEKRTPEETEEYEKALFKRHEELRISVGHSLRCAARLPDEDEPFIKRWDEAHLPDLSITASYIVNARFGPAWKNPRTIEAELGAIRSDLKKLNRRVTLLDSYTKSAINRAGAPDREEHEAAMVSGDPERIVSAMKAREAVPREQWAVRAALSEMDRLEAGIVQVIEQTIKAGDQLPPTGRIPNYEKNEVALYVADYLYEVTEKIPGLTTKPIVTGPFALALQEIFKILGLPAGVKQPGKWAISKLNPKTPRKF